MNKNRAAEILEGRVIDSKISAFFSTPRPARISLPGPPGSGSTRLSCQLSINSSNLLLAHFPDATFAPMSLDPAGTVFSSCVGGDMIFRFYARIDKVLGERDLELIISEAMSYPQQRRFFRIEAMVAVKCVPIRAKKGLPPSDDNELKPKKVNLSAVGLRFVTTTPLEHGETVDLEMHLPGKSPVVVCCTGRVVRSDFSKNNRKDEVAIDLEGISTDKQEKIIRFCLCEQRRQLRLRVRVLDPGSLG